MERAFSLIELLVVVAIIGVLAVLGVNVYNGFQDSAKAKVSRTIFSNVEDFVKSEIAKCHLGEEKIFNDNLSCSGRTGTLTVRAAERSLRDFKNPYNISQNAVVIGDKYIKGLVHITASNQNVILHACFKDSCGNDANKDGAIIKID